MGRGRIYKSDVIEARAALIAAGKHPSIDAVRVALGNTGSRTTIHRLPRELDVENDRTSRANDGADLSESLQAVVSQLADATSP